jgi:simple sugar transport system substrate-binding protein
LRRSTGRSTGGPTAAPAATQAPATEAPAAAKEPLPQGKKFVTIVKIAGINWFNRMEEGVVKWGKDSGVNATLVGPAQADAAQQIPIIEDLIAQGVVPSACPMDRPSLIRC